MPNRSGPYWSNPPFLFLTFGHSDAQSWVHQSILRYHIMRPTLNPHATVQVQLHQRHYFLHRVTLLLFLRRPKIIILVTSKTPSCESIDNRVWRLSKLYCIRQLDIRLCWRNRSASQYQSVH